MLRVENLTSGYKGLDVLKGVSLEFRKGVLYAILGPNGSGKSTLLKTIARVIEPRGGTVYLNGNDLRRYTISDLAREVAFLPQRFSSIPEITVFEAILLGRKPHISFEPTEKDLKLVEKIINDLKLSDIALKKITELSGGELQKVLIGRVLAQSPKVLLLDEPVNHLDPKNQIEILKLLKDFTRKTHIITILVLHDLNLAMLFADHFIFMKNGKVRASGDLQIINPPLIKEVYEINASVENFNGRKLLIPEV